MSADALAAGLCVSRLCEPGPELAARVRPAVAAARDASVRLPPLGLLADLTRLLSAAPPTLTRTQLPGLDLRRYDDRVVGPLLTDRRRAALCDAFAALHARWRGLAVAVLAERLADEAEPDGPWWTPAALRRWLSRTDDELWEEATGALADGGSLQALRARMATMSRRGTAGLSAGDVQLVQHLPALSTRAQRLAVHQVMEAASALDAALPRTVRPRSRSGAVFTGLTEEDRYPAGGFAGITTSGAPENLVTSELVYMDDDAPGGIDLFAVRYAEGELLYYTRDDSAHLRQRRAVHVVLDADLVSARVKDAELPWQRLVLVLGALHAVVQRVVRWLGDTDLQIVVHPLSEALDDEARLLRLVLAGHVDAGIVDVRGPCSAADVTAAVQQSAERAAVDVVWWSAGSKPPQLPVEPWPVVVGPASLAGWVRTGTELLQHVA